MMDVDYTDNIALLANALAQAKTLLLSLENGDAGIDLHINAYKMEYMCFNQRREMSTQTVFSETRRQLHLPWNQCLMNRDRYQHASSKGKGSYRLAIGHMEVRPNR